MTLDLLLYFVTDPTMVPDGCTFVGQIEKAIENGATIVQLREKNTSTLEFIEKARQVLEILKPKKIPLIINDRVDVAMAIDADGVHVGQDDMPANMVRKLIGPDKILGVSCGNPRETQTVVDEQVADYVGLGTLYPTNTKDVKNVCGPIGVRRLLEVLAKQPGKKAENSGRIVQSVAIGGINATNATKVMFQCQVPGCKIDGVAVVSCIMAAPDAGVATRNLQEKLQAQVPWLKNTVLGAGSDNTSQTKYTTVRKTKPLVHHITNNVVKNFSANVTLAIGASPVMSELPGEFLEFALLSCPVGLVINMGTPSDQMMEVFLKGLKAYNDVGKPVLFDPVAVGASEARLSAARTLLNAGHFSVIKGNVGEIAALATLAKSSGSQSERLMQGVDSVVGLTTDEILRLGAIVAAEFRTTVVITGKTDIVVDHSFLEANKVTSVLPEGGDPLMGSITGTGCSLGSVIVSFLAARGGAAEGESFNAFEAICEGVRLYKTAGALAGKRAKTPGSFMAALLDALYELTSDTVE